MEIRTCTLILSLTCEDIKDYHSAAASAYAARMGFEVPVTSYEAALHGVVSPLRSAGDPACRAQRSSAIEYPWWKNRAIVAEGQNALWSTFVFVFGLLAAIATVEQGIDCFARNG